MWLSNRLIFKTLAAVVMVLALVPAAGGSQKKGDKLAAQGREAELQKDWDKALDLYEQALATNPTDPGYQMLARRVRFAAGQFHVDQGQKLRGDGKLNEALKEFQKAFAIDPASNIAEQEMRRTYQIIDREEKRRLKGENSTEKDAGLTLVQQARKDADARTARLRDVPELRPASPMLVSPLKMAGQPPKILFETLGKLSGINVLFDQEFLDQTQARRYSVDLANVTLDEALDHLGMVCKAFWKPLSANTVWVTADNITKRRDYEDHVTKVFYIQNVTSPQDLTEIMTAMRTVTDARKVMPYNGQNAIVVRGTADQIALAEKVLSDLDKPRPEVLVDIMIIETQHGKVRDLAASLMTSGAPGINLPITYAPGGTAVTALNLNQFKNIKLGDYATSVPTMLIQAMLSENSAKILNQPQLRVMDGQKAQLNLGQRYPVATGSFQPGVGTVGVSPLVSTQFQYQDIGVNVGLTPRIHTNDEVSMEIEAEVSTILSTIDVGGLKQPIIASRKVKHVVRVKQGEIALIGGLMSSSEQKTRAGVPWLMDIPGLRYLFSTEHVDRQMNDLIIAVMPHIVRGQDINAENLRAVASGTEAIYKVNMAPNMAGAVKTTAGPAPVLATPQQMQRALGLPGLPGAQPQPPVEPAAEAVAPVQSPLPVTPGPPPPPPPAPSGPALLFKQSATEAPVGGAISVDVYVQNVAELFSTPMRLKYDGKVLKLLEIAKGPFLGGDGQQVTFLESKVADPGGAVVTMNRVPGAGGISGSGALVTLKFQALAKGETNLAFEEVTLRDARLQPIAVTPPTLKLTVK